MWGSLKKKKRKTKKGREMFQLCWKVNTKALSAEGQIALKKNNWKKSVCG